MPVVALSPTLLSSACNKNDIAANRGKKIIIIGAGISGLAAGKKLKEQGYDVTLLESQEKPGGRLRTNRSLGIAFDEGASWIHGINKNPITTLASQAGMETFETKDESRKSYDLGGVLRNASVYDDAEDELYTIYWIH